jgi:hypothetical protein
VVASPAQALSRDGSAVSLTGDSQIERRLADEFAHQFSVFLLPISQRYVSVSFSRLLSRLFFFFLNLQRYGGWGVEAWEAATCNMA